MAQGGALRLDRRVEVLQVKTRRNGLGERVAEGWTTIATVRAKYLPVSDGERLRAAAVEQKSDARFTLRLSRSVASIDGGHRLRFEGADWEITAVKPVGRRWIEVSAWKIRKKGA